MIVIRVISAHFEITGAIVEIFRLRVSILTG